MVIHRNNPCSNFNNNGDLMKKLICSLLLAAAFTMSQPLAHLVDPSFFGGEVYAGTRQRSSDASAIVTAAANRHGVPTSFALRVARQETGVRCGLWGDHGRSGGPLQIYWPTAHGMFGIRSFKTFRNLSCSALADLGMRHLAAAYRSAHAAGQAVLIDDLYTMPGVDEA